MRAKTIFVPGRLCIFGEHSDWAAEYIKDNTSLKDGHTIVACIDKGITANIKKNHNLFVLKEKDKEFSLELNNDIKDNNTYYSYVTTVVKYMKQKYAVDGVSIEIVENNLPQKKGLSSSACICVLVCRSFNLLYNLKLDEKEEMQIAYTCERMAKSKCGKMDQIVALNRGIYTMNFHEDKMNYSEIKIGWDLYFVFVDLKSSKNTKVILEDLHKAYPFPNDTKEKNIVKYLGEYNENIVNEAIELFKSGDAVGIGKLMTKAQRLFDKYVAPMSPKELEAPKLHELLKDDYVKSISLGGKGVGSQGDGSAQFIVENEQKQQELIDYIENELKLKAYSLKIKKNTNKINKAVIPLAGLGTRMEPFTNSIPKSFIPIVKDNKFKPIIEILIEELLDSDIDTIILIINKSTKKLYNEFFNSLNNTIKNHIEYCYQKEPLGLGDALLCAKKCIKKDSFLLVLGDQFYQSHTNESSTQQLLNAYNRLEKNIISVCETDINNVEKYGVFFGNNINNDIFKVTKIIEKPSISQAKKINDNDKYYIAYGEYIVDNKILEAIQDYKKKHNNQEVPFTELLEDTYNELYCCKINGTMYDVGNVESYIKTMNNYYK